MLSWSVFAIRMTPKKCVSRGTSQTFSTPQTSQCQIIRNTDSSLRRSGKVVNGE